MSNAHKFECDAFTTTTTHSHDMLADRLFVLQKQDERMPKSCAADADTRNEIKATGKSI